MARDEVTTLQSLEKPEDLNKLLRQDAKEDCTACRVVGGGAFIGLAAFNYVSGHAQLESRRQEVLLSKSMFGMRSRKAGITMLSLGLAWMGIWRLVK
ncbi:unnamed protein product [Parascedosporium putredinis]|uniref:Distal membrane-arm assembly complex protein 1-like domain-containing protein n=1 Tax=Parascedosporium putredinis TaxID=1442378 RepID=A0A9P1MB71_9PEZI|nr:unnamed protein product [Parascedosporium putredinis]CAI7995405.1 unnamed protein product [Parascedosporium putredinis]